ncbi:MAG: histidinol dehydrogenase, partial [Armatimonadetes bacterium]|nr:histidinol dehydrogenase [Armatimonadota bacterium]
MKFIDARRHAEEAGKQLIAMASSAVPAQIVERARQIVADVQVRGDEALIEYTRRFDWPDAEVSALAVSEEELA